jgi:uncharacterized protein (TIGR02145 family)
MKKIFLFFLCLASVATFAQSPQGIPYQAIARNASGVAIASTAVKVRFSIRDSIATGAIKYQETHNPTTSALGLFSVNVGMGTVVNGTFSGINWGKNAKFLQVELNTTGGTTYTDLGTTQMMSVPYALHSNTSDAIKMRTSATGDTLYTGGGNFLIIPGLSASNPTPPILNQPDAPITDIDGNVYQTVRIGTQVWMKENLKVSRFRNGTAIPNKVSNSDWVSSYTPGYCNFSNLVSNGNIYGKIYNWYAVNDPNGLCPTGWHIPSDAEFQQLVNYLGGSTIAGGKLKSTNLWSPPNTGANNLSGFTNLPAGNRSSSDGIFTNSLGTAGTFWSLTELDSVFAWAHYCRSDTQLSYREYFGKLGGFSVRCLKN